MKKDNQKLLIYAAGFAIAYFGVLRPILKKIGIVKGSEDRLINDQNNLPNKLNPFSPIYYKYAPPGTPLLRVADQDKFCKIIYNAMGWISDDEAAVYGVFRALKSQAQVSILSERFKTLYKTDLLEFLKNGKNQFNAGSGLNSEELSTVLKIVNSLPKYK